MTTMQVAINYSPPAADLFNEGAIQLDIFKIPAWDDLVAQLSGQYRFYIHFPLVIRGRQVINSETNAPVDWDWVDTLRTKSHTPYINIHFAPRPQDYPDVAFNAQDDATLTRITEDAYIALQPAIERFGKTNVIVENVPDSGHSNLLAATLPRTIKHVIEASDVGFLLDISHAFIAADALQQNIQTYLNALPITRIREMHTTGIEFITDKHIQKLQQLGIEDSFYDRLKGRLVDHLPFTPRDWDYLGWCLDQIKAGAWHAPDVVAFEFGGIGGIWEKLADRKIIHEQVNRLHAVVQAAQPVPQT